MTSVFVDPVNHTKERCGTNGYYAWSDSSIHSRATATHYFSKPDLKVVVLISPETKSSGEAKAISFKGRPNTWFIGEETGGYTTSNYSLVTIRIFGQELIDYIKYKPI